MDPNWNCTSITLVPKILNPSYVKDYRPIACCTVLYKIVSKIITARLAHVVGEVVDASQAGFIPGKHIGDNILLATELIKGYTHKHITPRCMLKVDLKKAYDSIEWCFIEAMLKELGFPVIFVKWIMGCVTTVSFSVLINGIPSVPFKGKKGLRQGDPMSPFLFAIGMEYLSRSLHELGDVPDFNFHPRCEKISLTHLMFADDLLMFSRADLKSVEMLITAFQKFSNASGLTANLEKSEVYFGGISDDDKASFLDLLGMSTGTIPFRYLGVPLSSRKLSVAQCRPLVQKITSRIDSWASNFLSYAGRLQLVKSVLFGIQTFWSQIFVLPKKIMKEIESKFRIFLWTGKSNPSKKALVAWKHICLPKASGGWNLISLTDWNVAAVCKTLWDIWHKKDSIWVKWVHIYYFRHKSLWDAPAPQKCSWVLKKILKCRAIIDDIGGWDTVVSGGKVKIKKVYDCIRQHSPKVQWKRLICNNKACPKSVFILWLAILNRLLTKDRLLAWRMNCDPACLLCLKDHETVNHLFFQCDYSNRLWQRVMDQLSFTRTILDFQHELEWIAKIGRKGSAKGRLLMMFLAETVYSIWIQRNNTTFNGCCNDVMTKFRNIVFRVSCRCLETDRRLLLISY